MKILFPRTMFAILLAVAAFGGLVALVSLFAGYLGDAINAALLFLSMIPALTFMLWIGNSKRRTFGQTQNIVAGYWIVPLSALAAYFARFLPENVTTSIISTIVVNILFWLLLVQITRKIYGAGRVRNIASASGRPADDHDVKKLANNSDLAQAIVIAIFTSAQFTILIENEATPPIFKEAIVAISMNLGALTGFLWFNFCPNQSDIRDLIRNKATHREPEKTKP